MKKVELLAPAGNMEALYQAIHNGCDAVYLGGMKFGARKFAANFDEEEMLKAIKYCHLYNVKIYVTVNTLIYDSEMDEAIDYVRWLHQNNVDAVIVQDLGLLLVLRTKFPNLVVHASTQMHNHNERGLTLLKELGVTRAVLARELTLEEIKNINVPIEKEVFVHGALCICYSGCCLMSSMIGGRSGNRGECAGSCRLQYELYENDNLVHQDGKYLLSPKDLNTLNDIPALIEAGITSFKIEGRMKSPTYVGVVVKYYRQAIDNYYQGTTYQFTEDDYKELMKPFNRLFTRGHLFNDSLMNPIKPNHMGILIGEVLEIKDKIKIKLSDTLRQNDGIQFTNGQGLIVNMLYNERDLLIKEAYEGSIVYLDNKINLTAKGFVYKTLDYLQNEEFKNIAEKKIGVSFHFVAQLDQPITLVGECLGMKVSVAGTEAQLAKTSPVTHEKVTEQLSKLGNTPFILEQLDIKLADNLFINIKDLNELRRECTEELKKKLENRKVALFIEKDFIPPKVETAITTTTNVLVNDESSLKKVIGYADNIYITDHALYNKYKADNIYFVSGRVNNEDVKEDNVVIGEIGSYQNTNVIGDYFLNVTNSYTVLFLETLGIKKITLSRELNTIQISDLLLAYQNNFQRKPNLEVVIYGKCELMVMRHCLISSVKKCLKCQKNKYYLRDRLQDKYYIKGDDKCLNHLYQERALNLINDIEVLKESGIINFRFDIMDEEDLNKVIDYLHNKAR